MAMFEKIKKTMSDRDMDAYMELVHEDAVFVFHKSGNNFSKSEWGDMAKGMLANEKFVQESSRCVYENEDIVISYNLYIPSKYIYLNKYIFKINTFLK